MAAPLSGKVCIVTGGTRGIGRGIAVQLGEAGATVYVTGRTLKPTGDAPGSLEETAKEIESRGGRCIPVQCDHSKEEDIEQLFRKVEREQNGRLDVLVNNAYTGVKNVLGRYVDCVSRGLKEAKVTTGNMGKSFWEQPVSVWDDHNNVGLKNNYICSVHAARLMVPRKTGLIVNISSPAGLTCLFTAAFGIGKDACDRMTTDCAIELRKHQVAFVSLWPGLVLTETVQDQFKKNKLEPEAAHVFGAGETPEYAGKCIVHLAKDPNVMKKSGRVLVSADLGSEYRFLDVNGKTPPNIRSLSSSLAYVGYPGLSKWVPSWIKIPRFLLATAGNRF